MYSNSKHSFSQLKSYIISSRSCIDFFNFDLNIPVRSEGQCILAPSFIRSEHSPSFAVYSDHCFDFATHKYYNLLDIYSLYRFGDSEPSHIFQAAEALSGLTISHSSQNESQDSYTSQRTAFNSLIDSWHSFLLSNPLISPDGQDIHVLDYFLKRRISIDTVKKLKIGLVPAGDPNTYMRNRIIFPYYTCDYQNPVYANGRASIPASDTFPKYKKLSLKDSRFDLILRNTVWGLDSQRPGTTKKDTRVNPDTGETETLETHHIKYDYLVISEGVFDTLAFWQEGYQVASALGCGFSQEQKKELLNCCKHYASKGKKVFLCLDNDKAGDRGQHSLALFLFKNRIPFVVGKLPQFMTASYDLHPQYGQIVPVKDVSDYYSAGGELEPLLQNAKPGVAFLAEHCKTEEELEKLFQDTAKLASDLDLRKLRDAALNVMDDNGLVEYVEKKTGETKYVMDQKPRFNRPTVNFLYAMACKPLMDSVIAEITCKAHNLMYDTAGQFYEYSAGAWRAVHELVVSGYISDCMNKKLSSGKLASVCKFLKISLAVSNLQFNTKPLWVFKNGTLWIDEPEGNEWVELSDGSKTRRTIPRNFKESIPDDMSTIQLDFNYRYKARNLTWEKYVAEWMDGQTDKINLLQQMTGYVLYAANTLQKFFYLIGDGANGKSTFLHILENLFGKQNCSSLQFHRFGSEFDAIALKNSRLNICYDARTELGNAEDILKAASSGDTLMAAHKGVDAEAFTTNAKIFVAANRFFSASDVSRGLLRRILFVCFNRNFSGEGQKLNIEIDAGGVSSDNRQEVCRLGRPEKETEILGGVSAVEAGASPDFLYAEMKGEGGNFGELRGAEKGVE